MVVQIRLFSSYVHIKIYPLHISIPHKKFKASYSGHNRDPENVSATRRCPLTRGSLKRFLINPFQEKVSVIRSYPLYRISAIERFYCIPIASFVPNGPFCLAAFHHWCTHGSIYLLRIKRKRKIPREREHFMVYLKIHKSITTFPPFRQ